MFDPAMLRARAERAAAESSFGPDNIYAYRYLGQGVLDLLDACDEAYGRLQAGDVMGAKLTLGWDRG